MSQDTPDHPSSCASCSDEIAALKSRMNELEHNNANLAERAASAETSLGGATVCMADANKYAAECEAKMKAATARAQARYTEKLHANNESRNLQKQVDQQKFDLHDYHVKTDNYFNTLKVQIKKLEAEKNEAGKSALEVQTELESLRNKLTAALEENQRQKAEWNNSKEQIKAVVMKMSSDLNAERAKVAASDEDIAARIDASKNEATREATVKYQSEVKDMEARFEARLAEVMHKSQEDLKVAAADSLSKEQRMLDCNGKLKQQLDDARKQLGLRSRQLQAALQSLQSMRDNQQNLPGSQQGQQSSPQQAPNTNKRRRVDSIG
ncbi:hypothetical protein GMOD_00000541 [Pyrenophora seminiperda CCB06]|uniref:Uncharacterized protein n=1 Tax=Pyrenophora seminiperda CCB06 TaxID=1302712 RepID=A0A3M7M7U9_9PLEO|nr:hypothetical protein GMOD_00000541 [Pyrenophora seminiperda CCB06]